MMGTGPFAVPAFEALLASRHEVAALVTQPVRGSARRGKPPPQPMREVAHRVGLPIFDPERINRIVARQPLVEMAADVLVVADYGQILNANTLALGRLGGLNIHASLLPRYRGAAPIHWAIYHGEPETGVSILQMTPELDGGPVLAQRAVPLGDHETTASIEPRLAELGATLMVEVLDRLEHEGPFPGVPQDPALASKAPILRKEHGQMDWSRSAGDLRNQVRAFTPWPKSFTFWHRPGSEPSRLIVDAAQVVESDEPAQPGTILAVDDRLLVACGQNALDLLSVQPAGKRVMAASEFLRGHPVQVGQRLGPADV